MNQPGSLILSPIAKTATALLKGEWHPHPGPGRRLARLTFRPRVASNNQCVCRINLAAGFGASAGLGCRSDGAKISSWLQETGPNLRPLPGQGFENFHEPLGKWKKSCYNT